MSRIRSIHPGLWTDEAFMSLSSHARLLIIGIWQEAFDDGVFEWKPLTIKARVFPVDNVDIAGLMSELVAQNFVRQEEFDGRKIGLVRNFRHYQRPKKPNSSEMLRPEWATYVGLTGDSSEPVPNQSDTSGEKSPQMEDGGWKMEDEEQLPPPVLETARPQEGARDLFMEFMEAYPDHPQSSETAARAAFSKLKPEEQEQAVQAAERQARWVAQEAEERGRTVEAQCRFSKSAANWLESGKWREPIRLKSEFVSSLPPDAQVVHRSQIELFHECETLSGETIPPYMTKKSWPAPVVAKAVANIKARASPQAVH